MPNQPKFLGVALDPRTEIEKAQDFPHAEIAPATASPVIWITKNPEHWERYPKRRQAYSYSCMAHSGAKVLGIENVAEEGHYVELSARPIYRARNNFPGEGMWQQDLFSLLAKPTACREDQMPSMAMTEEEMNQPVELTDEQKESAEFYRSNGYFFLPATDINEMARIIDKNKAVHLLLYFTDAEYWRGVPVVLEKDMTDPRDSRAKRHGVAVVDRTIYEGEKAVIIDDSAGGESSLNNTGQRILTESFLKARCYGAGYLAYRANAAGQIPKPLHTFTQALTFGLMHNDEVAWLQKVLQYADYLPLTLDDRPLPLGNMLQMTCGALKKWQVAHGILDFQNEPDVRKVRFGPKSIGLANKLYGY